MRETSTDRASLEDESIPSIVIVVFIKAGNEKRGYHRLIRIEIIGPGLDHQACRNGGHMSTSIKGVILAGGLGTRLSPLTKTTNKHLLPVYDRPMIYFPIHTLVEAGIEEIMIVTGGQHAGAFLELLGNGKNWGLKHLHYAYQKGNGGIAEALSLAREFTNGDKMVVMLGDNILGGSIIKAVQEYEVVTGDRARIFVTPVMNPKEYGIMELHEDDIGTHNHARIKRIIEKPHDPPSTLAVVGIYMYPPNVYEIIDGLEPSMRGELEITDVNNVYVDRLKMDWSILDGWWLDAGESHKALLNASIMISEAEGVSIR